MNHLSDETLDSMVSVTIGAYLEAHPEAWLKDAEGRTELKAIFRAGFAAGFDMAWMHRDGMDQIRRGETVTLEELRRRFGTGADVPPAATGATEKPVHES